MMGKSRTLSRGIASKSVNEGYIRLPKATSRVNRVVRCDVIKNWIHEINLMAFKFGKSIINEAPLAKT